MTAGHRTSHVWRDSPLKSSSSRLLYTNPSALLIYKRVYVCTCIYLFIGPPPTCMQWIYISRLSAVCFHIIHILKCANGEARSFRTGAVRGGALSPPDWFFNPIYGHHCGNTGLLVQPRVLIQRAVCAVTEHFKVCLMRESAASTVLVYGFLSENWIIGACDRLLLILALSSFTWKFNLVLYWESFGFG
jgi:hypothetical protein